MLWAATMVAAEKRATEYFIVAVIVEGIERSVD